MQIFGERYGDADGQGIRDAGAVGEDEVAGEGALGDADGDAGGPGERDQGGDAGDFGEERGTRGGSEIGAEDGELAAGKCGLRLDGGESGHEL